MRWHNTSASGYLLLGLYNDLGQQRVWFGLGGRTQTFGSYAAYSTDGLSMNLDGSGAINISNRGSSKRINLNTGTESATNFTTLRLDNQNVFITPDSNNGTLDAPIFRELTNTAYYVDPSSTGTSFYMGGGMVTTAPGGTILMKHAVSEVDAWIFQENAANWGLYWKNAPSGQHTFGAYTTVGAELLGMSAGNASGAGVQTSNYVGASSAWAQWMLSNYTGYMWSASTIDAAGDMRSPIFYDRNDTGFRLDPTDYSYLRYLKIRSSGSSSGTRALTILSEGQGEINFGAYPASWTAALQIQNNNNTDFVWISPIDDGYNARFRTGGCGLDFYTDGSTDAGNYSLFVGSGYAQGINSLRAPIFYDSNNTSYYVDPDGGGFVLRGGSSNRVTFYTNDSGFRVQNPEGNGTSDVRLGAAWGRPGVYSSNYLSLGSESYIEFVTGNGQRAYIDGGSNVFAYGSMRAPIFYDQNDTGYYLDPNGIDNQGLRIRGGALHGPNWSWGRYLYVGSNGRVSGDASVVTTNGNLHLDCQNGYETYINHYSGNRTYTYELRSTFIYDYNNTGYYLDMDGTSQLHYVMANNWFRAQGGSGFYTQDYGGHWRASVQSSYGTWETFGYARNGWGGINIIDPSGYWNHYMHESGNGGLYQQNGSGWVWYWSRGNGCLGLGGSSTVGGYRARVNGGLYVDSTLYVPAAVYGTIFYDANDSGYYLDPNGVDNQGLRIRGGTLHGPNWSWGAYLRVGTNGYLDGWAHVMTTNGNLHLDCRAGYETYINHYTGNRTYLYEIRTNFIYDRDNTGYYSDPNGTSRMNYVIHDNVYSYSWIFSQNNIIAYYSDERLKTNLGPIENPLDKVNQLNGFYYIENDLARSFGYKDEKVQVGLSAQQVQAVLPQVVTLAPFDMDIDNETKEIKGSKTGENYLTVDYEKIVPLLVEAIKELSDDLNKTKAEVTELRKLIEEK
jgi:hypothetical protein